MVEKRFACGVAVVATLLAVGLAGCRVRVDKNAKGEEKKVHVDTPFGGVHVNTDQTTAADLGLPTYPGAQVTQDGDDHKSADVHLGFGQWQLRVRAVGYASADSQEKVTAFYKNALGRYGDVLTCRNHQPVGSPKITAQGLTCETDGKRLNIDVNGHKGAYSDSHNLELKAGSKRHQHIVGFDEPQDGRTRFTLVALDLPASGSKRGTSD